MHQIHEPSTNGHVQAAEAGRQSYGQQSILSWTLSIDTLCAALDMAADVVLFVEPSESQLVDVNETACAHLGYSREELLGMQLGEIASDADHGLLMSRHDDVVGTDEPGAGRFSFFQCKDGTRVPVEVSIRRINSDSQGVLIVVARDIRDRCRLEDLSRQEAYRDALTGLPNRDLFRSRLHDVMDRARRDNTRFALLFIDIDKFKKVNDTLGHLAGDRVLRTLSQRIVACTRQRDMVTRYGGDEFLVLVESVKDRRQLVDIASRLSRVIRSPFRMGGETFVISASIGIAQTSTHQKETVDDLVNRSDQAMYRAKGSKRNESWVIDER